MIASNALNHIRLIAGHSVDVHLIINQRQLNITTGSFKISGIRCIFVMLRVDNRLLP